MKPRLLPALLLVCLLVQPGRSVAKDKAKDASSKPAKIKVNAKRGYQDGPIKLTLTTDAPDAKIFYTTDGSAPTPERGQSYREGIQLTTTTSLRVAGFRDGQLVTEVDTHTFLFLPDVLRQTGAGAPPTWGTNQGNPVPADYEMDPEVVQDPATRDEWPRAFHTLPAICVTMSPDDLFGPARGIYAHPRESGDDWERPAAVEFIPGHERKGFQIDCGIRIQGGWNRRPEESPKHAFRLAFRKKYGAGKLKFRLFDGPGADEFDTLILRAGCNNSWLHWSGVERKQGDYVRDQWMRESHAAMGHPAARGRFVHLFLNGLYWGVYNLTERPDERFAADHLGGAPKEYDARNGENLLSGDDEAWKRLLALANAGVKDATAYRAIQELLDLPAFADFMILNLYGANADWDRASNWYAARRRTPPGRFQFFVWDGERTLEQPGANTLAFDDDQSPPRLFQKLREYEEFRVLFGDRVQRHLGPGGVLSPAAAAARFRANADLLESAILAESARWGDYRRDVHPYKEGPYELYTRDRHWRPEIQRVLTGFFPERTERVLEQFREAGLFPALAPPSATKAEGAWTLKAPAGVVVYFTEDGSDPRAPGGAIADQARPYEHPIPLAPGRRMAARALLPSASASPAPAGVGAQWSPLVEP
jgi:hypothetical protein